MTTLCHSNFTLHRLLTDQGAFIHEHVPESFEDIGDGESGPHLIGGPAYDTYSGESHFIVVDATGLIVHSEAIDWDFLRWVDEMAASNANGEEAPEYHRPRRAGEDWQVTIRDEDGRWWLARGQCFESSRSDGHFFSLFDATQRAARFNERGQTGDWMTSKAIVVHADECPRCMQRRIEDSTLNCGLCGRAISSIGAK